MIREISQNPKFKIKKKKKIPQENKILISLQQTKKTSKFLTDKFQILENRAKQICLTIVFTHMEKVNFQ